MKIAAVAALIALCALTAGGAAARETRARTLTGDFVWDGGGEGALSAVFTPSGEDTWDVNFEFTFRGTPHAYSGTAEGTLAAGEMKGTVKSDGRSRTFTFAGTFTDGVFHGTHAEVTGGGEQPTGTLTLRE